MTAEARPARRLRWQLDRYSGFYLWLLLVLVFGVWASDTFLTWTTARSLAGERAITGIMALSVIVPMACGVFDLSIGHVMNLSAVVCMWLQVEKGADALVAVVVAVAVSAAVGAVSGILVTRFRISSFIATLGMASMLAAAISAVSGGRNLVGETSSVFTELGRRQVLGLQAPVYYLLALAAVTWYVLTQTPLGRRLYATGANVDSARLSGIRTNRLAFGSLVTSATVAGLAGVVYVMRIGSASPTFGPPFLLPAYAAVFLGMTQIRPGRVNVGGTLLALLVLGTGVKGLQLVSDTPWVDDLFDGLALLTAVALANWRRPIPVGATPAA